jgi:putative transposase
LAADSAWRPGRNWYADRTKHRTETRGVSQALEPLQSPSSGDPPRKGLPAQRWSTFVRNHAHAVLACDFFVTITVDFRVIYVFVVLEVGTRRIVHWNVTARPTAEWTIQQCRTAFMGEAAHRFLVHDSDAIYAPAVDSAVE